MSGGIMTLVFLGVVALAVGAFLLRKLMWALQEWRFRREAPRGARPGPPGLRRD